MSWGGSVLGMINSLKANARKRPSIIRGYPRIHERGKDLEFKLNYRRIRALSAEDRAALRKRVDLEKKLKMKKSLVAAVISLILVFLLLLGLNFLFHNHAETNPLY